jgi:hypothetical protein
VGTNVAPEHLVSEGDTLKNLQESAIADRRNKSMLVGTIVLLIAVLIAVFAYKNASMPGGDLGILNSSKVEGARELSIK